MNIRDYIDVTALRQAVADGWVIQRNHPDLPLFLYSYSRATVREQHWDDVTTRCRGLIVHTDGEVVARPFEKFFNFEDGSRPETMRANLPKTDPVVTDKLDGSLGILYRYGTYVGIASKGSFTSDHAKWATHFYTENHPFAEWPQNYTPVFEMICEDVQKHVVRYAPEDQGLHLLALINNETGEEINRFDLRLWAFSNRVPLATHYSSHTLESAAKETLQTDSKSGRVFYEGYVLSWDRPGQTPLRVKLKTVPFLRLQRLLHHTRPKHVLQALRDPAFRPQLNDWLAEQEAPQFTEFVQKWKDKLETAYREIETMSCAMYDATVAELGLGATRKDFALQFKEHPYAPVLFAMLPGKDFEQQSYGKVIWKLLEPMVHEVGPVDEDTDNEDE
jgi:RNA ligase